MVSDNNSPEKANHKSGRAHKGLVIILTLAILSFMLALVVLVFERFAEWHQEHGIAIIDEISVVFAILSFAFAIFSLRKWRGLQENVDNLKALHGLLPLCSSCKKVRDDNGSWNQLEAYIQNHSDAKITHGICPDCMKQLYGDFLEEDRNSERNSIQGEVTV